MFSKKIPIIIFILIAFSKHVSAQESKPFDLSAYKGNVVMLDFWASWCAPCRKSFPWLNQMQAAKKANGLVIIGINVDEISTDAEQFLQNYTANFKIIYDPKGEYASYYDIPGMPTSLIFDRSGKLIHLHSGFKVKNISEYERAINNALAK